MRPEPIRIGIIHAHKVHLSGFDKGRGGSKVFEKTDTEIYTLPPYKQRLSRRCQSLSKVLNDARMRPKQTPYSQAIRVIYTTRVSCVCIYIYIIFRFRIIWNFLKRYTCKKMGLVLKNFISHEYALRFPRIYYCVHNRSYTDGIVGMMMGIIFV